MPPEAADPTPPTPAPQPNSPEARTPTGEIKPTISTEPSGDQTTPEPKPEAKTVLNEKAAQGAPEKYEAFKAPEGFELDAKTVEAAVPIFKELGISQEGAQKLVDFYAAQSKQAAEAPVKYWQDMQEQWRTAVMADPEIGPKIDQVKTTVSRAIDSIGDAKLAQEFREAMDLTGAGNNPAFIKAFYKLAQRLTEGSHVAGNGASPSGQARPGSAPTSAARALYPNLP